MPEATLTFRFPGPRSYRGVAKVILVVLLGCLAGYTMILDDRANLERADSLTYDEYVEGYETYKEELTAAVLSPALNVAAGLMAVGVMASLYEILAGGLAWLIARAVALVRGGEVPAEMPGERDQL